MEQPVSYDPLHLFGLIVFIFESELADHGWHALYDCEEARTIKNFHHSLPKTQCAVKTTFLLIIYLSH